MDNVTWNMNELDAQLAATEAAQKVRREALVAEARSRTSRNQRRVQASLAIIAPVAPALPTPVEVAGNPDDATPRQREYIESLVGNRELAVEHSEWVAKVLAGRLSRRQASTIIDRLRALPLRAVAPTAPTHNVPAGRYAVDNEDGELRFYVVDVPDEDSKWFGRTFVSVMASDEKFPVKGAAAKAVLAKIALDPKEAMLRFGREIGACGHCGRTLTNEESRERGIGPICFGKMGW